MYENALRSFFYGILAIALSAGLMEAIVTVKSKIRKSQKTKRSSAERSKQ